VELRPLTDLPQTCPKCGERVQVTPKDILKPQKGE
jgi:hypothetical protein